MPQLVRHRMAAALLAALRGEGLGARDLFDGRQEPLSWFFRAVVYDQSELDILESGAVEVLHAPSALVELAVDELALALVNVGPEGLAGYLMHAPAPGEEAGAPFLPEELAVDPEVLLGYLNVDVAPPALWLEERDSAPEVNEHLSRRLAGMAKEVGAEADAVEVHIEGALEPDGAWSQTDGEVRPAGVSAHFTFDVPLVGTGERELAQLFGLGAATAARALERMRDVFER